MKTDREFWFRIGQQMKAAKEQHRANERESQHINQAKAADLTINPETAPKWREALEAAKNGKAPD